MTIATNISGAGRETSSTGATVETTYEVGYRKPPRDKQFKKGQSGNPLGTRKQMSAPEAAASIMSRMVKVNVNGKRRRVTMQEAMLLSQAKKAIAGDHKAAKMLFEFQGRAPAPEKECSEEEMEAAFQEAIAGFTLEQIELIATYANRMALATDRIKTAKAKATT